MSSQITVNQNRINFLSSGTSLSSLLSSNSNLYLNTDSGNFNFTSFKNTTSNVTCDKLTTTTVTSLSVNATNITTTSLTSNILSISNNLSNLKNTTAITSSTMYTNTITRSGWRTVTLSGTTTIYTISSPDDGLLFIYWSNGYAVLTYCWISGVTNAFITVISNKSDSNAVTFTISATNINAAGTNGTVLHIAQLKSV